MGGSAKDRRLERVGEGEERRGFWERGERRRRRKGVFVEIEEMDFWVGGG